MRLQLMGLLLLCGLSGKALTESARSQRDGDYYDYRETTSTPSYWSQQSSTWDWWRPTTWGWNPWSTNQPPTESSSWGWWQPSTWSWNPSSTYQPPAEGTTWSWWQPSTWGWSPSPSYRPSVQPSTSNWWQSTRQGWRPSPTHGPSAQPSSSNWWQSTTWSWNPTPSYRPPVSATPNWGQGSTQNWWGTSYRNPTQQPTTAPYWQRSSTRSWDYGEWSTTRKPQTTPGSSIYDNLFGPLMEPYNITCRKGQLRVPNVNVTEVDSFVAVFDGDNSLNCRLVLSDMHDWILQQKGDRTKRDIPYHEPVRVTCFQGQLNVSSEKPGESESTHLVFMTGGSQRCISLFHDFLDKVYRLFKNQGN